MEALICCMIAAGPAAKRPPHIWLAPDGVFFWVAGLEGFLSIARSHVPDCLRLVTDGRGGVKPGGMRRDDRWAMRHVLRFPPPRRGVVRVGAAAAQLDAVFAGDNNPHPNPPPAWGREKRRALCHMRSPWAGWRKR